MEEPPRRFVCPPEFEAVAGGLPLGSGGDSAELWLIRTPADFCPRSLEGCPVPLQGLQRLRPPPTNSDAPSPPPLLLLRASPGGGRDPPLLLSPLPDRGEGASLGCAPPLRGSLLITRSFGDPPPAAETPEEPARKRRKKKKHKGEGGE